MELKRKTAYYACSCPPSWHDDSVACKAVYQLMQKRPSILDHVPSPFNQLRLEQFINILAYFDGHIRYDFAQKRGRPAELVDKIAKEIEEGGEVIRAYRSYKTHQSEACRRQLIDEITDQTIAVLSNAFLLEYGLQEIVDSFERNFHKLEERWTHEVKTGTHG